jgi:peptidyl-tRNA hydrolase
VDHVLSPWSAQEAADLAARLDAAVDAIEATFAWGVERAMNQINARPRDPEQDA